MFETLIKIPGLNLFCGLQKTVKHLKYVKPRTESELMLTFQ